MVTTPNRSLAAVIACVAVVVIRVATAATATAAAAAAALPVCSFVLTGVSRDSCGCL